LALSAILLFLNTESALDAGKFFEEKFTGIEADHVYMFLDIKQKRKYGLKILR
jgi:hypothetical protein